jgi:hypothetical protein
LVLLFPVYLNLICENLFTLQHNILYGDYYVNRLEYQVCSGDFIIWGHVQTIASIPLQNQVVSGLLFCN